MAKSRCLKSGSMGPKKEKLHRIGSRPSGISKRQTNAKPKPASKMHIQQQHSAPTIPFSVSDSILLIGEGDLSFARSLVEHHGCTNLTATVNESEAELRQKYPQVGENIQVVKDGGGDVQYGFDAGNSKCWPWARESRRGMGKMDRVVFNFPHVGGKTKDVNRQVRYNQELLVSFFKNALPALSPSPGSSIIVTLFDGEPYTLWNIRDLARHSGLEVGQSFRFQASAYPRYKHARTLGVVKAKNGKLGGRWKGEERKARSYVFVRKGEGQVLGTMKGKKESSGDEDEIDDDITGLADVPDAEAEWLDEEESADRVAL